MTKFLSAILLVLIVGFRVQGQQLEISAGYLSRSAFTDKQKVSYGKGELYRIGLKYNQPLSVKLNDYGEPIL